MSDPIELTTTCVRGKAIGPHLLITAGVHGDEYEPMLAVRRLASELHDRLLSGLVSLVPVANENAFALGQRTAEDELDLARVCPGRDDGSITERTAAALSRLIRSADFYIDLHTGGTIYKILPLTGYTLHSNRDVLESQRAMAKAFGLPIVWGTTSRLDGRTLSIARDALVPAIYVESGGGEFCNSITDSLVVGCLNVAAHLGMMDTVAPACRVDYFVEDDRPASGHLQVQHPAPVAGLFVPWVKLGGVVRKGDVLGEVIDPRGETRAPVVAQSEGILLFVRIAPEVQKGDGLGGILPILHPGVARYEHSESRVTKCQSRQRPASDN